MINIEIIKALTEGTPVHFYGSGHGKSTLCEAIKNLGYRNITEAGDEQLKNLNGCMSIPEQFSGLLVYFDDISEKENFPNLVKELDYEREFLEKAKDNAKDHGVDAQIVQAVIKTLLEYEEAISISQAEEILYCAMDALKKTLAI